MYDVIVIGAGVMGCSAAYALSKRGKKTLLVEQFPLPHTRGSSHGASRITRESYRDKYNANIMLVANPMWRTLEQETGMELFKQTGMLCTTSDAPETLKKYKDSIKNPRGNGSATPLLNSADIAVKYPLLSFSSTEIACLDSTAGMLYADKCLQAFQRAFLSNGGVVADNCKALDVTPGDTVTVHTDRGNFKSKGVILTCGPWAAPILGKLGIFLPLKTEVVQVCYFKSRNGYDHSDLPSIITFFKDISSIYSLPTSEYGGMMKICLHNGIPCDPEMRDMVDADKEAEDLTRLKAYVANVFPNLIPVPAIKERCMYTNTPDLVSVVDSHPTYRNIAFAAGFSGHGFKQAPVIGTMLADLLQEKTPSLLVEELRANRVFKQKSKL